MYTKRKFYTVVSITIILTAFLTFSGTFFYCTNNNKVPRLTNTLPALEKYYYGDIDMEKLDTEATRAAVNSLGDPYTVFMDREEFDSFNQSLESEYCGIGVVVTKENENSPLIVVSSFENSPAKSAGIETGDKITKVGDTSLSGLSIDDSVKTIKGKEGTDVTISVIKSGTDVEKPITLKRQQIEIQTVYTKMLENNIGYINLTSFNENCGNKFTEELHKLMNNGAKSIIFDLRGNGGGFAVEAEIIANALLPKDSIVYSTQSKSGKSEVIKTTVDGVDIPLVLLVDENSASASEILAGAIKENGRGKLVGKTTFGKALVQTVVKYNDGCALKVTISRYFTPKGTDILKTGIEPDYKVDLKTSADEQLQFAIDLLK